MKETETTRTSTDYSIYVQRGTQRGPWAGTVHEHNVRRVVRDLTAEGFDVWLTANTTTTTLFERRKES